MSAEEVYPDHLIPVTENGERQIRQTAERFYRAFGNVPDVVIDSGYRRTILTADGLMEEFQKHKYRIVREEDLGLRERESGYSFLMSEEQVDEHFPFMRKYWPVVKGLFARPIGGESLLDVIENRLRWVILKVWKRYAGKEVCLVTHGRIYQCLRFILDDMDLNEMEAFLADPENVSANCGVTVYRYDPVVGKLVLDDNNVILYDH